MGGPPEPLETVGEALAAASPRCTLAGERVGGGGRDSAFVLSQTDAGIQALFAGIDSLCRKYSRETAQVSAPGVGGSPPAVGWQAPPAPAPSSLRRRRCLCSVAAACVLALVGSRCHLIRMPRFEGDLRILGLDAPPGSSCLRSGSSCL